MISLFKIDRLNRQYRTAYKSLPAAKRAADQAIKDGYVKATLFTNGKAIYKAHES